MEDLRNFNEILRKDVTYHNTKSHKKGFLLSLALSEKFIFGKTTERESQIDPQAGSGLREYSDNYSKTTEFITIL